MIPEEDFEKIAREIEAAEDLPKEAEIEAEQGLIKAREAVEIAQRFREYVGGHTTMGATAVPHRELREVAFLLEQLGTKQAAFERLAREFNATLILKAEAERQVAGARAALERDRCKVADAVTAVKKALAAHEWLRLGRGSYEYNDDRWKDEFSAVYDGVLAAIEPLKRIAADWSNCPMTQSEIIEARALLGAETT